MNADGGTGNVVLILAALAAVALALVFVVGIARARKASRVLQASENARRQEERERVDPLTHMTASEQEEETAWLERVRVQREKEAETPTAPVVASVGGKFEDYGQYSGGAQPTLITAGARASAGGSGAIHPYPIDLPPVTAEQKFAKVFNDCHSQDLEKARKARATVARTKLLKAKKKARRGKKK